jgi:hypothetical protein
MTLKLIGGDSSGPPAGTSGNRLGDIADALDGAICFVDGIDLAVIGMVKAGGAEGSLHELLDALADRLKAIRRLCGCDDE